MDILEDCKKIKEEFSKRGYDITLDQAEMIWDDYSQLIYFASWLPVEIDHHVFIELMDLEITKEIIN